MGVCAHLGGSGGGGGVDGCKMMMTLMMMPTVIAHDSINLKVQWGWGGGVC